MSLRYKVGDRLGDWNALYLQKTSTVKNHNHGLFLCPICQQNIFEAEPSRVAHNRVHCCKECLYNEKRKYKEGTYVGKYNNILIVKNLPDLKVALCCPICGRKDWIVKTGTIHNLQMCYDCYRIYRKENFGNGLSYSTGDLVGPFQVKLLSYETTSPHSYCWFECKSCEALFLSRLDHMIKGLSSCYCDKCRDKSSGEKIVQSVLEQRKVKFYCQYSFQDCKNIITGYPLRFDFYLPEYNCCIEYDGRQHFDALEFFGGDDGLKANQYRDKIKDDFCNQNNIILIRIPYTASFQEIETVIDNFLKRG